MITKKAKKTNKESSRSNGKKAKTCAGTVMTVEKFGYYFDSIKDLIRSGNSSLKKDINGLKQDVGALQVAVCEHSGMIKKLGEDIQGVRTELKEEIQSVRTELKEEIQSVRTELKEEMHLMEGRLSDKIDGHSGRLDDHEVRISTIERRPH